MKTPPLKLAALIEGSHVEIPDGIPLSCTTEVDFKNDTCVKDNLPGRNGGIIIYAERTPANQYNYVWLNALSSLQEAGKYLIVYQKKLKQTVMDSCSQLKKFSNAFTSSPNSYSIYTESENAANCIQDYATRGNDVKSSVHDSDSEETTTGLPTEISEFYNTTIRPFIESQTEFSVTASPYANSNTTSETPLGISGKSSDSTNSPIYNTIGGVAAAGVLVAGMAAMVWRRKNINEKRRKRYAEMVSGHELNLAKSSENNSVIPQNPIV